MKNVLIIVLLMVAIGSCKTPHKNHLITTSASSDSLYRKYQLDKISLPAGFSISVFAEVPNARSMCLGEKGTLFVGNRTGDKVYAAVDSNNDGRADAVFVIASGLNTPNGVAFRNGSLYVAEINRILRFDDIESRLENPPPYSVVYDKYPTETHHGWKFIAFGPDGRLYVPVGAPCNICLPTDLVFASITSMNADGSDMQIFAKGIRNSVGFAFHPQTKELWFTDNGRDLMGDDTPYCELNHAPKPGMHFGFPFIHQGDIPDPEFGKGKNPADYTAPALKVGPHAAPLGMRFYTGSMFPAEFTNRIFIAEHGSWNRTKPYGYQVKMATLLRDSVVKYENFATGWLRPDDKVIGRPVDVLVMPDGALLISDDQGGAVYRVTYKK